MKHTFATCILLLLFIGCTSHILRYDWDGKLLSTHTFNGLLKSISLSSDRNVIYCSGYDNSGKYLYRITLD